jgi:hypothetical protein
MHKVPNARFIELEPRALVRIHFPRLTPQGKSVCVSEEHMAMLYDSAIYPAAVDILPEDLIRGWASKYGDEKLRAKAKRTNSDKGPQGRTLQQTGRDVHARFLNAWVRKFREIIENTHELRWARCFFFGVEMRGMKNREASLHPPPEEPLVNDGTSPSLFELRDFSGNLPFTSVAQRARSSQRTTQGPRRWTPFLRTSTATYLSLVAGSSTSQPL